MYYRFEPVGPGAARELQDGERTGHVLDVTDLVLNVDVERQDVTSEVMWLEDNFRADFLQKELEIQWRGRTH